MTLADYQALPHVFARPNGHTAPVEELVRRMIGMDLNVRATTQSLLEMLFMLPGSPFAATVPERVAQPGAAAGTPEDLCAALRCAGRSRNPALAPPQ